MNRLARERSPYLLQHAGNPVDWYPWGEEAFEKARREDKPIFLSIGYSTCHWCHVMEHESFENAEVAAALNADFVSIKVDREERPDVDRVYMTFVQSTTGSGGWPMTVFLTPDLKPFFGGTYFPPHVEVGPPRVHGSARRDQPRVEGRPRRASTSRPRSCSIASSRSPAPMAARRRSRPWPAPTRSPRRWSSIRRRSIAGTAGLATRRSSRAPSELLFLLREHARTGAQPPLYMAVETLRAMALGGMRDHVGGGFHRYSVDARWRVPHFEKMLYDQAQLVLAYLEAAQATGERFFAAVAEDTLAYVLRDLRDPAGGFYSAEDADSVPPAEGGPKTEGAFYVWTDAEIDALLGADADIVRRRFGIEPDGNAPQDPHGEFTGQNLLYTARRIEEIVAATGRSAERRHRRARPRAADAVRCAREASAAASRR